jgi:hypothetical protein
VSVIRYSIAARAHGQVRTSSRAPIRIDLHIRPRRIIVDPLFHGTGTGLSSATQVFLTTSMINPSRAGTS